MICCGVGCVTRVKFVKIVKIVKMVWAAGVWVYTPSENGENSENGGNVMGCWG